MWWHWPRSKMVPIISNFECMPIESMATIKLTCDTWFRYCTIDRQILWYSSQQTQYKRSKCPIDRLSKNHQRSLWNDKWGSLINSMTLSMYTNTLVAGCSQSSAFFLNRSINLWAADCWANLYQSQCSYIANGASQRRIGGPSSSANFIDIGYVNMGTRRRLHKMYWDRTWNWIESFWFSCRNCPVSSSNVCKSQKVALTKIWSPYVHKIPIKMVLMKPDA